MRYGKNASAHQRRWWRARGLYAQQKPGGPKPKWRDLPQSEKDAWWDAVGDDE